MDTPGFSVRPATRAAFVLSTLAAALALTACGPQNGAPVAPTATAANVAQPAPQPVPAPPPVQYVPAPVAQAPAAVAPPVQVAQAPQPPMVQQRVVERPVASNRFGEVSNIEPIRTRPKGTGTGAVIGGVLGAVVGNQFGHGTGRAATTVLGGAAGAVVGNNLERNHNEGIAGYRVTVHLDNGQSHTYEEASVGDLHVGDRVRIDNGRPHRV